MGQAEDKEVVVNTDTFCTIVFIPPGHHLLMRFTISSYSTIVRILTDRFQLLSYMDAFFLSWCQDARALAVGGNADNANVGSSEEPRATPSATVVADEPADVKDESPPQPAPALRPQVPEFDDDE